MRRDGRRFGTRYGSSVVLASVRRRVEACDNVQQGRPLLNFMTVDGEQRWTPASEGEARRRIASNPDSALTRYRK